MHPSISALPLLLALSLSTIRCSFGDVQYKTKPLKLGIEGFGIRLQDHANDSALCKRLRADTYRHRFVLFRGQGQIPPDAFLSLFDCFGDAFRKPFTTQGLGSANHKKSPSP